MADRSQLQRSLLLAFVGSIALCGVVGAGCLLAGSWGHLQARVVGTAAAVAVGSILGLAGAAVLERRRWPPLGAVAIGVAAAALVLSLVAIWAERLGDEYYKAVAIACTVAVALPHAGMIGLARVEPSHGWVVRATLAAIALLAAQIVASVVGEVDDEGWYRVLGVLAIAVACGTIAVPILHRIAGLQSADLSAITVCCPRCGHRERIAVGGGRCSRCGLGIRVELDEAGSTGAG